MSISDKDEKTATGIAPLPADLDKTNAYLVVVAGTDSTGRMFRLDRDGLVIGRALEADICLEDSGVSRHHAKVVIRGDKVEIVDLGSKNGIIYQGERCDQVTLKDGDKFQIGASTVLKLSYQDFLDEAYQRNLYESATRDGLTHVYNKRFFTEVLAKDFSYAQRHEVPLTLVMADVDHFKNINDTFGHPAGDLVLMQVAGVMANTIRSEDLVARVGGEEFAILLRECDRAGGIRFAERLRQRVEKMQVAYHQRPISVTISAGVAELRGSMPKSPDELFSLADQQLYAAKNKGRNRVEPPLD